MRRVLLVAALAVGCAGDDGKVGEPPTTSTPTPTPTPEPTPPTTPEPTPPTPTADPLAFTAITVAPHPEVGSMLVVTWEQNVEADVHLAFSVDPGEELVSPVRTLGAGAHEEWILGVPYGMDVTWQLVGVTAEGTTEATEQVTPTEPPPPTLPVPMVWIDDPTLQDADSRYLFTALNEASPGFNDVYFAMFVDRRGRTVWSREGPQSRATLHARPSADGASLLIDHNSFWGAFDGGAASEVERVTIDGTVLQTTATPGLHHPFTDLADGTLVYAATSDFAFEENVLTVAPDGTVTDLWSCREWLQGFGGSGGCNSNTLDHDPVTDTFLLSLYSHETIVEIDATTGASNRWFGHQPGSYAFDPPQSAFWWQHGVHYTDTGTLLVSSDLTSTGVETIVREYTVDAGTETLTEVWSFAIGDGLYGGEMGEPHRLSNGNILHNYGSMPRVREALPDGTVVWDVEWDPQHEIGRSTFVPDLYAYAPERP